MKENFITSEAWLPYSPRDVMIQLKMRGCISFVLRFCKEGQILPPCVCFPVRRKTEKNIKLTNTYPDCLQKRIFFED